LSGATATFATSSLSLGNHSIKATYSGDANNVGSTSATLVQAVNVPADSIKLRALQVAVTPVVAQVSGQAISGAIDNAIEDGFSDNVQPFTSNGSGFTFNFGAEPNGQGTAVASNGVKDLVLRPIAARTGSMMRSQRLLTAAITQRRRAEICANARMARLD
jgi:hypothetical protein